MRRLLVILLFIIITLLKPPKPKEIKVKGTYTHEPTGKKFPESIEPFKRVAVTQFDRKGLNVSVGYNKEDKEWIGATVYIYPSNILNRHKPEPTNAKPQKTLIKHNLTALIPHNPQLIHNGMFVLTIDYTQNSKKSQILIFFVLILVLPKHNDYLCRLYS